MCFGNLIFWECQVIQDRLFSIRNPKLKWPGCGKMLERKYLGKIEAMPAGGLVRFFQGVYAQEIVADWSFLFWFSGLG